jgi:hypothetical protein
MLLFYKQRIFFKTDKNEKTEDWRRKEHDKNDNNAKKARMMMF